MLPPRATSVNSSPTTGAPPGHAMTACRHPLRCSVNCDDHGNPKAPRQELPRQCRQRDRTSCCSILTGRRVRASDDCAGRRDSIEDPSPDSRRATIDKRHRRGAPSGRPHAGAFQTVPVVSRYPGCPSVTGSSAYTTPWLDTFRGPFGARCRFRYCLEILAQMLGNVVNPLDRV